MIENWIETNVSRIEHRKIYCLSIQNVKTQNVRVWVPFLANYLIFFQEVISLNVHYSACRLKSPKFLHT